MANRIKGSSRWRRSSNKVARCHAHAANVWHDFAHKTSRKIVDSDAEVFVFENLNVQNMTKAPKPKKLKKTVSTFLTAQRQRPDSIRPFWNLPGAKTSYLPSIKQGE